MAWEIERKFLVAREDLPDLSACHKRRIEQAYLSGRPTVRVRLDNDDYYLTYKGDGQMIREEYNLPLTAEAYFHLAAKADGRRIEKDRYEFPLENGLTAEIDLFTGALAGLIFAEVEFETAEAASAFSPPPWFGREVTEDSRYSNAALALQVELPEQLSATETSSPQKNRPVRLNPQWMAGLAMVLTATLIGACAPKQKTDDNKTAKTESTVSKTESSLSIGAEKSTSVTTSKKTEGSNSEAKPKPTEITKSETKSETNSKPAETSKSETKSETKSKPDETSKSETTVQPEPTPTPEPTPQPEPAPQPEPGPQPQPSGSPADLDLGFKVVVNKKHPLPADYAPGENPTALAAVMQLIGQMQQLGYAVSNNYSGFRSYETQASLYQSYVARDGQAAADTYSARPGYSEHQTGLAFDLLNSSGGLLGTGTGDAEAASWVAAHAHEYGFIVRYQPGKEGITGYMPEPWHLRYVGPIDAAAMYRSGHTLEEYMGISGGDYLN